MADTTCQHCGESFGNAGARANHERACDDNPGANAGDGRQETHLERRTPVSPAQQAGGGAAGIADTLFVLANFDEMPSDMRRQAVSQGAGLLGGTLNRWLDLREASIDRKQARAEAAELTPIEELPQCECGYQFDAEELAHDDVRCPSCQTLYAIEVRDVADA